MDIRQNALALLEAYFKQTPPDQVEALLTSIDQLETDGGSFQAYLEGLDRAFDYSFVFEEPHPVGSRGHGEDWAICYTADEDRDMELSPNSGKGHPVKIKSDDGWLSEEMTTAA
jgi:hypothetical protein